MIPVNPKPYPDELLFSYFNRLAAANCLGLETFYTTYADPASERMWDLAYDIRTEFPHLYGQLYEPGNMRKMYLSLTTFRFEAMAMTPGRQTKYINYVFRPQGGLVPPMQSLIPRLKVCPDCMKEDVQKYGEPYFHRSHQLSGVSMCHKHGTVLRHSGPKAAQAYGFDGYEDDKFTSSEESMRQYAAYAQDLFESDTWADCLAVRDAVRRRMAEAGYDGRHGLRELAESLKACNHRDLLAFDIWHFLNIKLMKGRNVSMPEMIPVLMYLFPEPGDFLKAVAGHAPVLGEYVCPDCGYVYCATPQSIAEGWGCPRCRAQISDADMFRHLAAEAGYEPLEAFTRINDKIPMKHAACGRVTEFVPEYFLFRGSRCQCEGQHADFDPRREIEKGGGFKLIRFTGSHSPVTIYHEACGREFKANYYHFLEDRRCRYCDPPWGRTTE